METPMTEFDAYIPMEFRWALTHDALLPDRTQGAVLFADISGSTRLTAALAGELGPRRGAEELTQQLDHLFTALVAQVHRYHGSVIGFSGDAITCWFDQNTHPQQNGIQQNGARRATAAALAMQAAMSPFAAITTPSGASFTLRIKVAVVAGAVRRFVIGNPAIQCLESLAGATMNRLALAEQQAQQGEVVVDAEIVTQFAGELTVKEWRQAPNSERFAIALQLTSPVAPLPWPSIPSLQTEAAQPWLLPPVFQRLQAGHSGFLAELRPVVAFFLKFSGIDYDGDDAAGAKLDGYIRWVQSILARFEGYLMHVTMGDKGSYLNAAFGALQAHEDDPIRAIAAALALQVVPPKLQFIRDVQIGIGQDQGYVGAYGSAERRTFGILGNEVNLAARLMSVAQPGEILLTPRIANAVSRNYKLEKLEPITVKGMNEPLVPSLVRGRQTSRESNGRHRQSMPSMVGRQTEKTLLAGQLQALGGTKWHCHH
jgi:adenylate cyclase